MSFAMEVLTKEELMFFRSYDRKRRQGRLHETTEDERAARNKYNRALESLRPLHRRYSSKKSDAKRTGLEFTLTFEDFVHLCNSTPVCPLLGLTLDYSAGHGNGLQPNTASLDRINPTKGYTKDNCWIISNRANRIKSDATISELEQLVNSLRRLTNASTPV